MTAPVGVDALRGRRVALTRPEPGVLGDALAAAGAHVVSVPLIEITGPADGGRALAAACARIDTFAWLVVTSANGVRALARVLTEIPAPVRLAAVGPATADALVVTLGRPADFVPSAALGAHLAAELPGPPARVLIAQADRAAPTLAAGLRARGHDVEVVTAYATVSRRPSAAERAELGTVDAVVFASGSAVQGWVDAGLGTAPLVVAIGPSTAAAATARGLPPAAVADTPDAAGVVAAVRAAIGARWSQHRASP